MSLFKIITKVKMVESSKAECLTVKLGKRPKQNKEVDMDLGDESCYEIRDGLRFVKPYEHEFVAFVKRRWVGQTLIDVFSKEFKAFSKSYYTGAIGSSRITLNGKKVDLNYKLKDGDKIVHKTVREETPILCDLPEIIF